MNISNPRCPFRTFRIRFSFHLISLWIATSIHSAEPGWKFQENVMIPMRDGVRLAANVFTPVGPGPFPTILMRTPYGKSDERFGDGRRYSERGYALVIQDCRGRGDSEGIWDPFRFDPTDGFDTQEWVGTRPWSNGRIGTAGGSYGGWTQWASAPDSSRYLTTMIPVVPFGNVYREITYPGGAYQLALSMGWGASVGGIRIDPAKMAGAWDYLPLARWDDQFGQDVFYLEDWVAHPTYDGYWRQRSIDDNYEAITVPILNIGGWYDIFSRATIDLVDRVRERSNNRMARRNQCVIIGPWGHGPGGQKLGELDFGEAARRDLRQIQDDWFDYWLTDRSTGVEDWPPYQLFVMGANTWRGEHEWPLARAVNTRYYLHSNGSANTREGDGVLGTQPPAADQPRDEFIYDPRNPVPTRGGNNLVGAAAGPFDQADVESRTDVLVYSTPPLESEIEVTGPVTLVLHAASSAVDTDFTAKLVDVHPDGTAYNLCDGIIRARYRESFERPTPIEPGKIHRYEIDLWVTSNLFKAGHRIRLEVSSSNYPRFNRNPNTGEPFGSSDRMETARQIIVHDAAHPSHLLLPIIPGK